MVGRRRKTWDEHRLRELVSHGETMDVEFKEDHPAANRGLSDNDIVEAVVCMANLPPDLDGGMILIGVQDDGRITGTRARHGSVTDPNKLQAMIFGRTEPR